MYINQRNLSFGRLLNVQLVNVLVLCVQQQEAEWQYLSQVLDTGRALIFLSMPLPVSLYFFCNPLLILSDTLSSVATSCLKPNVNCCS